MTKKKRSPAPPRSASPAGWPANAYNLCVKLVDCGLGAVMLLAMTVLVSIWLLTKGMTSVDRKEMVIALASNPILGFTGWVVAVFEAFVFKYIYQSRDSTHEQEMKRVADVKNEAVQANLDFQLQTSEPPQKRTLPPQDPMTS